MRIRRLGIAAAVVSAAAVVLAACGSGNDVRDMEPKRGPNLSLIRPVLESDLDPASYPAEIVKLRGAKVVVTGAVESIEAGRNLYLGGSTEGEGLPSHMIVLKVRVSDILLDGLPGAVQNGYVYVELFQGATNFDGSVHLPLSVWRKAIPVGTKTILFLYGTFWTAQASSIVDNGRGRPDGAKLVEPDPQGMIFEFDGQLYSADSGGQDDGLNPWDMHSIDEVAQDVKDRL